MAQMARWRAAKGYEHSSDWVMSCVRTRFSTRFYVFSTTESRSLSPAVVVGIGTVSDVARSDGNISSLVLVALSSVKSYATSNAIPSRWAAGGWRWCKKLTPP